MESDLKLLDVFLTDMKASRGVAIPVGRSTAQISVAVSDLNFETETVVQVGSRFEIVIQGEDEEEPHCEVLTEYVIRVNVANHPGVAESRDKFTELVHEFALESTFSMHRDRIMEATMRMEVPIFRLPVTLEEVENRAGESYESDSSPTS
ncbi:hypothetical protein [Curtobacterium sp. MCPF17_011]|uniref:hypothetical protein n=1 Tax=Curtobacterium sp. MCPF17_011 TaxID=2175652 RepID=UPI0011B382FE|nr:hypothetical protein [Curtobacterium sp. MCPF17_011]